MDRVYETLMAAARELDREAVRVLNSEGLDRDDFQELTDASRELRLRAHRRPVERAR